jgi:hypothetical protein
VETRISQAKTRIYRVETRISQAKMRIYRA